MPHNEEHKEESKNVLLDKNAAPSTLTETQRKSLNIKQVQKMLKASGLYEGKIDGVWGPNTQAGLDAWQEKNTGLLGNQLSPYLSPLNVAALRNDLSGADAPISQSSLSSDELDILRGIVRGNLAKGKTNIEYGDYATGTQYGDVGGADTASYTDQMLRALDPAYNLKSTLGQASIAVTPQGDTLVVDQYNFNNASGDTTATLNDYLAAVEADPSLYNLFRSAGTVYGSPEGEGAQVLINTAQRKNGGWLDKYAEGGELKGSELPTEKAVLPPTLPVDSNAMKAGILAVETPGEEAPYEAVNPHSGASGKYQFMPWWNKEIKKFAEMPKKYSKQKVMEEFRKNPQLQEDFMDHVMQKEYVNKLGSMPNLVNTYGKEKAIAMMHFVGVPDAKKFDKAIKKGKEKDFKVKGEDKGENISAAAYMKRFDNAVQGYYSNYLDNLEASSATGKSPQISRGMITYQSPLQSGILPGGNLPTFEVLPEQKKGGWLDSYEDGGKINTLEGNLISKILMERNRDKDFVQRAYNPDPNKVQYNPDGTTSTHKMAWGTDETGQAYMFPTIFNENNEAIKVPNMYADYISSQGYKKATGMDKKAKGGWLDKY
jgi:hypothetical protein